MHQHMVQIRQRQSTLNSNYRSSLKSLVTRGKRKAKQNRKKKKRTSMTKYSENAGRRLSIVIFRGCQESRKTPSCIDCIRKLRGIRPIFCKGPLTLHSNGAHQSDTSPTSISFIAVKINVISTGCRPDMLIVFYRLHPYCPSSTSLRIWPATIGFQYPS